MTHCRRYTINLLTLVILILTLVLQGVEALAQDQPARIVHIDSGLSIRNYQKSHYYPMMSWDETPYKEFAYWEETDKGSIVEFLNFRVLFPSEFDESENKENPAIVMLHGIGGSGRKKGSTEIAPSDPEYDSNSSQLGESKGLPHLNAVNRDQSDMRSFPGIIIAPQSSYNAGWGEKDAKMIAAFLEWMIEHYQVDPDRIALHGLSNGAKGVWKLASSRPDLFSAILPMSGVGTNLDSMTDVLLTTPTWIFQGDQDRNPSAGWSRQWYDALIAKGGTPRYTLYENTGHSTWGKAYAEPDFFPWIKAQHKKNIHVLGGLWENPCEAPAQGPVELGFSAGYLHYQWVRNGQDIPGATERFYTAHEQGIYQVKFLRRTDSTWDESYVLDVFYTAPDMPAYVPGLQATGETTLPVHNATEDKSLKLVAESGFAHYEWYRDGILLEDSSAHELVLNNPSGDWFQPAYAGNYVVRVADQNGCMSSFSDTLAIRYEEHRLYDSLHTTRHFAKGLTIRNLKKHHYFPMVDWDAQRYEEFALWHENTYGYIRDFMNWRAAFPEGYTTSGTDQYPAVVVLHGPEGAGRGSSDGPYPSGDPRYDNNSAQLHSGGPEHLQALTDTFPGMIIYPQASHAAGWSGQELDKVIALLEWMITEYRIDPGRITLEGHSGGAWAVWKLLAQRPDLFAAAITLSGIGSNEDLTDALAAKPIRMFQGEDDTNPSPQESAQWHDSLIARGANVRYTLYEGTGHNTWQKALAAPDYFAWIHEQGQQHIRQVSPTPTVPCDRTEAALGVSTGHLAYQWRKDGEVIPGAIGARYTVSEPGTYQATFRRRIDSTWVATAPLEVFTSAPEMPALVPGLEATGATTVPVHDSVANKSLILQTDTGFASYTWYRDGIPLDSVSGHQLVLNNASGDLFDPQAAGRYTVVVADQNGCSSRQADTVHIAYEESRYYDTTHVTVRVEEGLSIRDNKKAHYYPMTDWDQGQYKEFAWWEENEYGFIVDFMNFRVALPPDFDQANDTRYPAILMLHGSGQSGRKWDGNFDYAPSDPEYDNNGAQLAFVGKSHYEAMLLPESDPRAFPGLVILPQTSYNAGWGDPEIKKVIAFMEWMIRQYPIDEDRITVHGLSNGAKGVWKLAAERPDLFASALSMSGVGTDLKAMTDVLSTTPLWIFQGSEDTNPSPVWSREWYDTLVAKGAEVRYTLYDNTGHNTWTQAYAEPDFFTWIRQHDQKNIQVMSPLSENPCERTEVVRLGFSAGFTDYQWTLNGEEIAGANERFVLATEEGIYRVRFKRRTDGTLGESYPQPIYYGQPGMKEMHPLLEASGPTDLPWPQDTPDKSLNLVAEAGFASYCWFKGDSLLVENGDHILPLNDPSGELFSVSDTGRYRVVVKDANGCFSLNSNTISVTYDPRRLLAVEGLAELVVYPNPFTEEITIDWPSGTIQDQTVMIYDQVGRRLLHREVREEQVKLNLAGFQPGVYLLVIGEQTFRIRKK